MAQPSTSGSFHLPWNGHPAYWLCAQLPGHEPPALADALLAAGMKRSSAAQNPLFLMHTSTDWEKAWEPINDILHNNISDLDIKLALIPGEEEPSEAIITSSLQPADSLERIAKNIWLGKLLQENAIRCYFQPLVDNYRKTIGYESFARIEEPSGEIITGQRIIGAAEALNIEHVVDRYLHREAASCYREHKLDGMLFLNFIPGFIHRPAIYLQGLNDAIDSCNIPANRIVLDFTRSDSIKDFAHFRAVVSYCRSKGYRLALDDIPCMTKARKLIEDIRPDFVKLDRDLCVDICQNNHMDELQQLCTFAHGRECKIVAEGIETADMFNKLNDADIDYFQGYYFAPPQPPSKC